VTGAIEQGFPLKVVGDPLFLEPLGVAIDKGDPEWGARLEEIINEMHADGTLSELSQKVVRRRFDGGLIRRGAPLSMPRHWNTPPDIAGGAPALPASFCAQTTNRRA
jgi:hypothetical protein